MTPEEFQAVLAEQGIELTDRQMKQFALYYELLIEWNQKMNLTAIVDEKEVYLKHFYDSLLPIFSQPFENEEMVLCDVGAGGGFPSLPIKILYPSIKVTIVDSLNKRITFLEHVVRSLELEDVRLCHDRAEIFGQKPAEREKFDCVTARAVAKLSVLSELCLPLVKPKGNFIALKAARSEEEIDEAQNALNILGGSIAEELTFSLPVSGDERHIIVIKKEKKTPGKYPRKPGTPAKNPIV